MTETIGRLNIKPENLNSYKRIQLLKAAEPLEAGDYETAKNTIAGLKLEQAIRAQLLGLLAEEVIRTERQDGLNLYEQAIRDANGCWFKSDQILAAGVLIESLHRVKQNRRCQALLKQTLFTAAVLSDCQSPQGEPSAAAIESLSALALNLFRSRKKSQAKWCLKKAFKIWAGLPCHDPGTFQIQVEMSILISLTMAEIRDYRRSLRMARRIRSTEFNGLEYFNYELTKASLYESIAALLLIRRKRRLAKKAWLKAARVIVADVHDDDRLRAGRLTEIANQLDHMKYCKIARQIRDQARTVLDSDKNPAYYS
jgi:hypothetical protein